MQASIAVTATAPLTRWRRERGLLPRAFCLPKKRSEDDKGSLRACSSSLRCTRKLESKSKIDEDDDRVRDLIRASSTTALGTTFFLSGLLASTSPALAAASQVADEIETLFPKFSVEFLGVSVNHQQLVEYLVLGQFIGFIGSSVSGYLARKRKAELEELNNRLLQVTKELRKQTRAQRKKLKTAAPHKDDRQDQKKAEVLSLLKRGKQALSEKNGTLARDSFQTALDKMKDTGVELESPWRAQRKAFRGLGAAYEELGEHTMALQYMKEVVRLSESNQDHVGLGDAYGVIADIFTEQGNFEEAAKYYDLYIAQMDEK